MSQSELAERLGIRQSSISQWERGATEPTGRRLLELIGELPGLADALKGSDGFAWSTGSRTPIPLQTLHQANPDENVDLRPGTTAKQHHQ